MPVRTLKKLCFLTSAPSLSMFNRSNIGASQYTPMHFSHPRLLRPNPSVQTLFSVFWCYFYMNLAYSYAKFGKVQKVAIFDMLIFTRAVTLHFKKSIGYYNLVLQNTATLARYNKNFCFSIFSTKSWFTMIFSKIAHYTWDMRGLTPPIASYTLLFSFYSSAKAFKMKTWFWSWTAYRVRCLKGCSFETSI